MIKFDFIGDIKPEDDEICDVYAIYGCDRNNKPHFLIVGGTDDEQAPVIDLSNSVHEALIFDSADSAIKVANCFGLISNIKLLYSEKDFELTLNLRD